MRPLALLYAVLVTTSCYHVVPGPLPPNPRTIAKVQVESLPPRAPWAHVIDDATRIQKIAESYAISPHGWAESRGRELLPLFRINLVAADGTHTTYWLGTNSHPAEFPCYSLCTGWWVAPSNKTGALDASLYKGLPDSVYFYFIRDLGIR